MNRADAPRLTLPPSDLVVGGRTLLAGLELQVEAGQCWAVVGANGRGKSSLLAALAGLDPQWRERVRLDDRPLTHWPAIELARHRAWLGQHTSDVFGLNALQIVLLARHARSATLAWDQPDDVGRALQCLQTFDVAHLAGRDIRTLSGGERQRVALAAIWAQDCPLLLLDEPCNHLDLAHQLLLMQAVEAARSAGRSVILVLHDLNWVSRCASHVLLLLDNGGWLAGPAAQLMTCDKLSACLSVKLECLLHPAGPVWLASEPVFKEKPPL